MERSCIFIYALLISLLSASYLASPKPGDSAERAAIAAQIENSIKTELLNKWYPQSMDQQNGGFLSTFTYDWKPTGTQDKMIVT